MISAAHAGSGPLAPATQVIGEAFVPFAGLSCSFLDEFSLVD